MNKYSAAFLLVSSLLFLHGCKQKEEDIIVKIPTLNSYFSPEDKTAPPVVLVAEEGTYKEGIFTDVFEAAVPQENQTVRSPLEVRGQASSLWFSGTGTAPVEIISWNDEVIGKGVIEAPADWFVHNVVPFKGTIEFMVPPNMPERTGWIVFKNSNSQGLPENNSLVEIPIRFEEED